MSGSPPNPPDVFDLFQQIDPPESRHPEIERTYLFRTEANLRWLAPDGPDAP